MVECFPTLWEKEKLLVTSNFSFSCSVFKRLVLQTHENKGLFRKELIFAIVWDWDQSQILSSGKGFMESNKSKTNPRGNEDQDNTANLRLTQYGSSASQLKLPIVFQMRHETEVSCDGAITPSTLKNQVELSVDSPCIFALSPITTNRHLGASLRCVPVATIN